MELKAARLQAKLSRLQQKTNEPPTSKASKIRQAIQEEFGDTAIVTVKEAPIGPVKRAQVRKGAIKKPVVDVKSNGQPADGVGDVDMAYSFLGPDGDSTVSPATKVNSGVLLQIAHSGKMATDGMLYSYIGDDAVSPATQAKSSLFVAMTANGQPESEAAADDVNYSYVGELDSHPETQAQANALMHVLPEEGSGEQLDAMMYSFVGDDEAEEGVSPATQANSAVFIALTQPNQQQLDTAYMITISQPKGDDMEYGFVGDSDTSPATQANSTVFIALTRPSQNEEEEVGDCQVYSFLGTGGDSDVSPTTQANSSVFIAMAPKEGESTSDMAYSFVDSETDPATKVSQSLLLAMANAGDDTDTPYTFITMDGDDGSNPWTQANSSVFMALQNQS